jgi:hypothetical protein
LIDRLGCDCGVECLLYAAHPRIARRPVPPGKVDSLAFAEEEGRLACFEENLDETAACARHPRLRPHILARYRDGRPAHDHGLRFGERFLDGLLPAGSGGDVVVPPGLKAFVAKCADQLRDAPLVSSSVRDKNLRQLSPPLC